MISFKQGADVIIPVPVVDSPTVDLTTAIDVHVELFVAGVSLFKYSLNPKSGYGTLTVTTPTNTANVYVEREECVSFPAGSVSATVIASFTDSAFEGGVQRKVWDVNNVARVQLGRSLDDIIP